jgi:hypothetical protein
MSFEAKIVKVSDVTALFCPCGETYSIFKGNEPGHQLSVTCHACKLRISVNIEEIDRMEDQK